MTDMDPKLPYGLSDADTEGPETVTMRVLLSREVEVEVAKADDDLMYDRAVLAAREEASAWSCDGWIAEVLS